MAGRASRRTAITGWFRAKPSTRIGGVAGASALGVSGLFGGLDAAPGPAPALLEEDQQVTAAPFEITVKKLATLDSLQTAGAAIEPDVPGGRLFVVSATVENITDRPLLALELGRDTFGAMGSGIVPWAGDVEPIGEVISFDDGTSFREFNPGLTYEVVVVYQQEAGWQPGEVTLSIYDQVYRTRDVGLLTPGDWAPGEEIARGDFAVDVIEGGL